MHHRAGSTDVWARRTEINRVIELIRDAGTLAAAASLSPGSIRVEARGDAHILGSGHGRPWFVRTLRHGGFLRGLTRDRFCSLLGNRPLNELRVAAELERVGIRTPPVVAAAAYRSGPWYRGEVAREFVQAEGDLAGVLFSAPALSEDDSRAACAAAGRLIAQLHRADVLHPDLNLRNVLIVSGPPPSRFEAWIIDLEKCRVGPGRSARLRRRMLGRLRHSAERFAASTGRSLPPVAWPAFEAAYAEAMREG